MGWMRRLRTTVLGSRDSRNFDDEVRFHLAERTDEYIRNGLTRDQAEREAQRRFGDVTRAREWTRDADTLPWLREFGHDVRYTLRTLGKNPGFTTTALLTLALGIGTNTAIFAVAYGVLWRPLPYPSPDQLVRVSEYHMNATPPLQEAVMSHLAFNAWREHAQTLTGLAAYSERATTHRRLPRRATPRGLGRTGAIPATDSCSHRGTVLRSPRRNCWRRLRRGSLGLLLAESFRRAPRGDWSDAHARWCATCHHRRRAARLFVPGSRSPAIHAVRRASNDGGERTQSIRQRVYRHRPVGCWRHDGASRSRRHERRTRGCTAANRSRPLVRQGRAGRHSRPDHRRSGQPAGTTDRAASDRRCHAGAPPLGGANVANLLFRPGIAREREFAVRAAIGAGRGRLLRQMFAESLVLAMGAAVSGVFLAWALLRVWPALVPRSFPRIAEVHSRRLGFMGAGGIDPDWRSRGSRARAGRPHESLR